MNEANYLIVECFPGEGQVLHYGGEPFDSYAEALNSLVSYSDSLADDYDVDPIVNGHFFYRLRAVESDSRAVWIEAVAD